jgi:hypothetical protein
LEVHTSKADSWNTKRLQRIHSFGELSRHALTFYFASLFSIGITIGAPVLERTLDRKTKECTGCGFKKWFRGDKLFIVQSRSTGTMEWLCPDCAVDRGLPPEHYHRNRHSQKNNPLVDQGLANMDFLAGLCRF